MALSRFDPFTTIYCTVVYYVVVTCTSRGGFVIRSGRALISNRGTEKNGVDNVDGA